MFCVDAAPVAGQHPQDTLEDIARRAGLRDLAFQYEPTAAAFDYESQITRDELVPVVDIGGGTSDFTLIRVGPARPPLAARTDHLLATGRVPIGAPHFHTARALTPTTAVR